MKLRAIHSRRIVYFILSIGFGLCLPSFGQHVNANSAKGDTLWCGVSNENNVAALYRNGEGENIIFGSIPAKPLGKNFRVAALYFKLANDEFELGRATAGWPHDMPHPLWKNEFLINVPYDSTTFAAELARKPESLTAYFYHMSGGHLWLYGDEVTYTGGPLVETDYGIRDINQLAWLYNNRRVLGWLAANYDLNKLDNDKNGTSDLILLICRSRLKFGFSGANALPFLYDTYSPYGETRLDASSGTYQTDCYLFYGTRHLVAHELGHNLGLPHLNGLLRWNLMAGGGYTTQSGTLMSAQERKLLGWLDYEVIDKNTSGVRLSNLVRSNRAVKIPIKGTAEYFVAEHRTHHTLYETPPSQPAKSGLLFSYVSKKSFYNIDLEAPNIILADGLVTNILESSDTKHLGYYNGDGSDLFGYYDRTEITPFTKPSTSTPRYPHTGIALKNIHREGEDFVFDVYFDYTEAAPANNTSANPFHLRSYPNPLTWKTTIFYELVQAGNVKLTLYNALGQELAVLVEGWQEARHYEVRFDGFAYPAGVYYYVLETATGSERGRMLLLPKH